MENFGWKNNFKFLFELLRSISTLQKAWCIGSQVKIVSFTTQCTMELESYIYLHYILSTTIMNSILELPESFIANNNKNNNNKFKRSLHLSNTKLGYIGTSLKLGTISHWYTLPEYDCWVGCENDWRAKKNVKWTSIYIMVCCNQQSVIYST